jgi:hypothetical protein
MEKGGKGNKTYDIHEVRVTASVPHDTRKNRHWETPGLLSRTPYLVRHHISGDFGR